jgi:hypothetical protein|tara:strand:+ start:285 stop:1625 length:1341 start_codon:yes stop_codon:yes gene_type:complete
MGLNNIQKSNPKVLNRPMFRPQYALMKDGSIKPVTYAWYGVAASIGNLGLKGGRYALPYMKGFGKKLIDPKTYKGMGQGMRDYFKRQYVDPRSGFQKLWGGTGRVDAKTAKGLESVYGKLRTPKFNIRSKSIPNLAFQTAVPYAAYKGGAGLYNFIKGGDAVDELETETETIESSDRQPGIEKSNKGNIKEEKKKFDDLKKEIKKGNLDDYIKENKEIFEKYLGDTKDEKKKGAWEAVTQFGLNLATAKGDNFVTAVAESAKGPLQGFTNLGKELADRADKITMASIEAGMKQKEGDVARAHEKELLQLEAEQGGDDTALMKNFNFFKSMFGGTKSDEELIALSKSASGTSRKDFFTEGFLKLTGAEKADGTSYTEQEVQDVLNRAWNFAQGGGEGGGEGGAQKTTYTEEDIVEAMESNVKEDGSSYSKDEVIKIFEEDYQLTPEK